MVFYIVTARYSKVVSFCPLARSLPVGYSTKVARLSHLEFYARLARFDRLDFYCILTRYRRVVYFHFLAHSQCLGYSFEVVRLWAVDY